MAEGEDRTEAPSAKRLEQARRDGNVAISREMGLLASLGVAGGVALATLPAGMIGLQDAMRGVLGHLGQIDVEHGGLAAVVRLLGRTAALAVLPIALAAAVAAIAIGLLQTGLLLRLQALMPDLGRVSPLNGAKRVFGVSSVVEALKSLAKLGVFGVVLFNSGKDAIASVASLAGLGPNAMLVLFGRLLRHGLIGMLALQALIAILDVGWTRYQRIAKLRMTRQELRDEFKESEGDPHIKGRLRQLRQRRARRRMLDAVPSAAVVITNPTHYAVALAYEHGGNAAPKIVAKGVDEVAARIREAAREHNVPLVPNPPLARALHKLELDAEIPREHFQAVAAIIAFVWRQKRARLPASRPGAAPAQIRH